MNLTLLLPWFPIILGVGVGGRLLGRTRGFGLGILCALFWIMLVQATAGTGIWAQPGTVVALLAGAAAIIAMGGWSGEMALYQPGVDAPRECEALAQVGDLDSAENTTLEQIASVLDRFDDWLADHRNDADPWPKFDEFVRSALCQLCHARHVRPFRLRAEGGELVPLREPDPLTDATCISARLGILGHVVTTGRSYVASAPTQGEFVSRLAEESSEAMVRGFAITRGTRRLGAVSVGHLDLVPPFSRGLLDAAERLISQLWGTLVEACQNRSAGLVDPVSGLLTREAFLRTAEPSLGESYAQGEPVAVAVIALEHLRNLNDSGRWEMADELVREASAALRRKVRLDDRVGWFDGSRFVLLLRRVDSELASLIVSQIMSRLTATCGNESRWGTSIGVRCGVVGSGTEHPDIRTLVTRALNQAHRAREENVRVASDLGVSLALNGSTG